MREIKRNCTSDIKFLICLIPRNFVLLHSQKQNSYSSKIQCYVSDYLPRLFKTLCLENRSLLRMNEHGKKPDQAMHRNLKNCSYFQELGQLHSLPCDAETVNIDIKDHLIDAVLNICGIMDETDYWSQLNFLDAYYIKTLKPEINDGLKAYKELDLFK